MNLVLPAISLGLLGSLHCIGMCGPIALSLPVHKGSWSQRLFSILLYNAGRVATYALMGMLFGSLGSAFAVAGLQQVVSVALGSLILLFLILPSRYLQSFRAGNFLYRITASVKASFAKQLGQRGNGTLFVIGLLNGLLPCGLVYMAIAGAIASARIFDGALFMALFGAGTVPAMMAVAFSKTLFPLSIRTALRRAVPFFVGAMALLLVLRGLNLGIPYVSPAIERNQAGMTCCSANTCKK